MRDTPLFLYHGLADEVITVADAALSYGYLRSSVYNGEWTFNIKHISEMFMEHAITPLEIDRLRAWLTERCYVIDNAPIERPGESILMKKLRRDLGAEWESEEEKPEGYWDDTETENEYVVENGMFRKVEKAGVDKESDPGLIVDVLSDNDGGRGKAVSSEALIDDY